MGIDCGQEATELESPDLLRDQTMADMDVPPELAVCEGPPGGTPAAIPGHYLVMLLFLDPCALPVQLARWTWRRTKLSALCPIDLLGMTSVGWRLSGSCKAITLARSLK